MPNQLFNLLGGSMASNALPFAGFPQMIQQFNQFKATFQGDPQIEVQKLLQSGQMSQQQLNQLQSMAQQFKQFM